MDFKKIAEQAKSAIDKRGGTESLKEDLGELKGIASGGGSITDKAKAAAAAVKDPGEQGAEAAPADAAAAAASDAGSEASDIERGKDKHRRNHTRQEPHA